MRHSGPKVDPVYADRIIETAGRSAFYCHSLSSTADRGVEVTQGDAIICTTKLCQTIFQAAHNIWNRIYTKSLGHFFLKQSKCAVVLLSLGMSFSGISPETKLQTNNEYVELHTPSLLYTPEGHGL